jgi:hypothetical protein
MNARFRAWTEAVEKYVVDVVIRGKQKGVGAASLRAALCTLSHLFLLVVKFRRALHSR